MNVQVVAAPDGTPLWFSRTLTGRTNDLSAARAHGVIENCHMRWILVLVDPAYQAADAAVRTPYTTTTNCPSTTSSTTGTTLDCAPLANAPSHG